MVHNNIFAEKGIGSMFTNIGRKVRGLAVALCVIGILGALGAAVFLYLTKILDLVPCIIIAAGGVLVAWLSSWVLYCIGDTHVRIMRLEDKLIPKPSYAEYLAGSGPVRGFAVTLTIGILTSMFTSVTVSRLMVEAWMAKFKPTKLPL